MLAVGGGVVLIVVAVVLRYRAATCPRGCIPQVFVVQFILWYSIVVECRRSAFKHGFTREDIGHAVIHALCRDDDAYETNPPRVLILGPDSAANILEIFGELEDGDLTIFHVMKARPQFLDLLRE